MHLVASAEAIAAYPRPFVFTDGHAEVALTTFFDHLGELNEVDWALMVARYWADTLQDPDRKRRRQAEFLVHEFLPWDLITGIGVHDAATQGRARAALAGAGHQPPISVTPEWYY